MSEHLPITLTLDGRAQRLHAPANAVLADVLRDQLGRTGVKIGCDAAACGACTVLLDGLPVASCATFAFEADGRRVTTIHGLGAGPGLPSRLQQAFMDFTGYQCGYCTPGMVVAATALLAENPAPTREEVRAGLAGNICRCTGYEMIIDAVMAAAQGTDMTVDRAGQAA
jgi:aerobic-type carbon monoxide dehydrogenase small subunit (CoxS/CutS family)